eukprot:m.239079 g.239079  ORF g.239079 m.239079 type:complete len:71 (-) comp15291_c0_seq2:2255-2467(-)
MHGKGDTGMIRRCKQQRYSIRRIEWQLPMLNKLGTQPSPHQHPLQSTTSTLRSALAVCIPITLKCVFVCV